MKWQGEMDGFSEEKLVSKARKGDVDSFTELMRRYQERIYKTVFWLTKDHNDADDLVQEAFLHAYKHLCGFRMKSSFSTWVYRIAVNRTLNFLKKRSKEKNRIRIPVEDCSADLVGEKSSLSPEKLSLGKELREKLDEAIESLPLAYRASFVLVVIQGLSHLHAAQVLGCSENTVSWRMFRARKMLQKKLLPYLEGEKR
jgi:RNA polymerase sigma-70 factor (ECF subfamily)